MKFAGFEEIYRKFFPESENLFWDYSHWCRDRLRKLRLNGLVKTFQFPGSPRKYLITTEKGRRAWKTTKQTERVWLFDIETGGGSKRQVEEFYIHPNVIKSLGVGQCVCIKKYPESRSYLVGVSPTT